MFKIIAQSVDRTHDLQIFSLTLSQLSYLGNYTLGGTRTRNRTIRSRARYPIAPLGPVLLRGFEPRTFALQVRCSTN